jgi:S1-C subfamily serine protease
VHELRGRLDHVSLVVERKGLQLTLAGRLPPAPAVLQRRGILVSGMLLAPLGYRDTPFLGLGHDIGIHDLESGSDAEANELNYWDLVLAVDDEAVQDMEQLYRLLQAAATSGREVTLDFVRRGQVSADVVFEPLRRRMEIDPPEWVTVGGE